MSPDIIFLLVDLSLGAIGTFLGILLWSLTRESAWMLMIIAVIVHFGETVFRVLTEIGIFTFGHVSFLGVPVFWVAMRGTAWLLIMISFAIMIRHNRT